MWLKALTCCFSNTLSTDAQRYAVSAAPAAARIRQGLQQPWELRHGEPPPAPFCDKNVPAAILVADSIAAALELDENFVAALECVFINEAVRNIMGVSSPESYRKLVFEQIVACDVIFLQEVRDTILSLPGPPCHTPLLAVRQVDTHQHNGSPCDSPESATPPADQTAGHRRHPATPVGRSTTPQPQTADDPGLEGLRLHPCWLYDTSDVSTAACGSPTDSGCCGRRRPAVVLWHRQPLGSRQGRSQALQALGLLSHLDSAVTLLACSGAVLFQNSVSRRYYGRLLAWDFGEEQEDRTDPRSRLGNGGAWRQAYRKDGRAALSTGGSASASAALQHTPLVRHLFSCDLSQLAVEMAAAWAAGRKWKHLLHVPPPVGLHGGAARALLPLEHSPRCMQPPPPPRTAKRSAVAGIATAGATAHSASLQQSQQPQPPALPDRAGDVVVQLAAGGRSTARHGGTVADGTAVAVSTAPVVQHLDELKAAGVAQVEVTDGGKGSGCECSRSGMSGVAIMPSFAHPLGAIDTAASVPSYPSQQPSAPGLGPVMPPSPLYTGLASRACTSTSSPYLPSQPRRAGHSGTVTAVAAVTGATAAPPAATGSGSIASQAGSALFPHQPNNRLPSGHAGAGASTALVPAPLPESFLQSDLLFSDGEQVPLELLYDEGYTVVHTGSGLDGQDGLDAGGSATGAYAGRGRVAALAMSAGGAGGKGTVATAAAVAAADCGPGSGLRGVRVPIGSLPLAEEDGLSPRFASLDFAQIRLHRLAREQGTAGNGTASSSVVAVAAAAAGGGGPESGGGGGGGGARGGGGGGGGGMGVVRTWFRGVRSRHATQDGMTSSAACTPLMQSRTAESFHGEGWPAAAQLLLACQPSQHMEAGAASPHASGSWALRHRCTTDALGGQPSVDGVWSSSHNLAGAGASAGGAGGGGGLLMQSVASGALSPHTHDLDGEDDPLQLSAWRAAMKMSISRRHLDQPHPPLPGLPPSIRSASRGATVSSLPCVHHPGTGTGRTSTDMGRAGNPPPVSATATALPDPALLVPLGTGSLALPSPQTAASPADNHDRRTPSAPVSFHPDRLGALVADYTRPDGYDTAKSQHPFASYSHGGGGGGGGNNGGRGRPATCQGMSTGTAAISMSCGGRTGAVHPRGNRRSSMEAAIALVASASGSARPITLGVAPSSPQMTHRFSATTTSAAAPRIAAGISRGRLSNMDGPEGGAAARAGTAGGAVRLLLLAQLSATGTAVAAALGTDAVLRAGRSENSGSSAYGSPVLLRPRGLGGGLGGGAGGGGGGDVSPLPLDTKTHGSTRGTKMMFPPSTQPYDGLDTSALGGSVGGCTSLLPNLHAAFSAGNVGAGQPEEQSLLRPEVTMVEEVEQWVDCKQWMVPDASTLDRTMSSGIEGGADRSGAVHRSEGGGTVVTSATFRPVRRSSMHIEAIGGGGGGGGGGDDDGGRAPATDAAAASTLTAAVATVAVGLAGPTGAALENLSLPHPMSSCLAVKDEAEAYGSHSPPPVRTHPSGPAPSKARPDCSAAVTVHSNAAGGCGGGKPAPDWEIEARPVTMVDTCIARLLDVRGCPLTPEGLSSVSSPHQPRDPHWAGCAAVVATIATASAAAASGPGALPVTAPSQVPPPPPSLLPPSQQLLFPAALCASPGAHRDLGRVAEEGQDDSAGAAPRQRSGGGGGGGGDGSPSFRPLRPHSQVSSHHQLHTASPPLVPYRVVGSPPPPPPPPLPIAATAAPPTTSPGQLPLPQLGPVRSARQLSGGGGGLEGFEFPERDLRWHEVTASPFTDPLSGEKMLLLVQADVTARVEAERRLVELTAAQTGMLEQMFPRHVLEFLVQHGEDVGGVDFSAHIEAFATTHDLATVLFTDIVGFTTMSKMVPAAAVMAFLSQLYSRLDALVDEYGVWKVETAGDCYIVAAGVVSPDADGFQSVITADRNPRGSTVTPVVAVDPATASATVSGPGGRPSARNILTEQQPSSLAPQHAQPPQHAQRQQQQLPEGGSGLPARSRSSTLSRRSTWGAPSWTGSRTSRFMQNTRDAPQRLPSPSAVVQSVVQTLPRPGGLAPGGLTVREPHPGGDEYTPRGEEDADVGTSGAAGGAADAGGVSTGGGDGGSGDGSRAARLADELRARRDAEAVFGFALAMLHAARSVRMPHNGEPVQLRVGIHSGPLVSGVIGTKMPKFALFGDTMNTASRMESTCQPGCIQVSAASRALLPHLPLAATGGVHVKGKGIMETFVFDPSGADAGSGAGSAQVRAYPSSSPSTRAAAAGAMAACASRCASAAAAAVAAASTAGSSNISGTSTTAAAAAAIAAAATSSAGASTVAAAAGTERWSSTPASVAAAAAARKSS